MASRLWLLSTRDGRVHLFRGRIGNIAVAVCPVSVATVDLEQPRTANHRRCAVCWAASQDRCSP